MFTFSKSALLELLADEPEVAGSNPFASVAWLKHWVSEVARDDWEFLVHTDGESLRPLFYSDGGKLRSLSNYYTILAPSPPAEVVRCLGADPLLELRPLDPVAAQPFIAALREAGWYVRTTPAHGNWYLPCNGVRYEDYLTARPSQLRNTLKRKAKKFPGTIELCTGDDLERAIGAYQSVYTKSWKVPEPYPGFVPGWMRICAQNGWLRLATAWLGDVPIAAQFWFVYAGVAHVYKLAYDEEHKEHSAGTILTARLMQRVLEVDKVREVDYGSGDDAYKRDWMSARRERVVLTAIDQSSVRGKVRAGMERLAVATAPLRKRLAA